MQGYPIGSFLFWSVEREHVRQYKFYDFVRDYHQKLRPHCHPTYRQSVGEEQGGQDLGPPPDGCGVHLGLAKTLARPLMAAAFIWVWLNVAEISWDVEGLIRGFTGGLSMGELLGSLPESGIGLLVATLFPGLGTFALLPATIMARLLYLLYRKVLSWVKDKGFVIHWDRIGVDRRKELVPVL